MLLVIEVNEVTLHDPKIRCRDASTISFLLPFERLTCGQFWVLANV